MAVGSTPRHKTQRNQRTELIIIQTLSSLSPHYEYPHSHQIIPSVTTMKNNTLASPPSRVSRRLPSRRPQRMMYSSCERKSLVSLLAASRRAQYAGATAYGNAASTGGCPLSQRSRSTLALTPAEKRRRTIAILEEALSVTSDADIVNHQGHISFTESS